MPEARAYANYPLRDPGKASHLVLAEMAARFDRNEAFEQFEDRLVLAEIAARFDRNALRPGLVVRSPGNRLVVRTQCGILFFSTENLVTDFETGKHPRQARPRA